LWISFAFLGSFLFNTGDHFKNEAKEKDYQYSFWPGFVIFQKVKLCFMEKFL